MAQRKRAMLELSKALIFILVESDQTSWIRLLLLLIHKGYLFIIKPMNKNSEGFCSNKKRKENNEVERCLHSWNDNGFRMKWLTITTKWYTDQRANNCSCVTKIKSYNGGHVGVQATQRFCQESITKSKILSGSGWPFFVFFLVVGEYHLFIIDFFFGWENNTIRQVYQCLMKLVYSKV